MSLSNLTWLLNRISKGVDTLVDHDVPRELWLERVKWLLHYDLKQIGTVEEKEALIDNTFREITADVIAYREANATA